MKKLFAIIFAIIFVCFGVILCDLGVSPTVAEAAEVGASISISDTSAYQGEYVYLYVRANDFVNVASLELSLVYDAEVFEFRSVQKSSLMPSDAVTSENSDTAGMVGLYAVSSNGITGSGNLWYVQLQVKSNAPIGGHSVQILAGECVDSALNPVSVTTSNCTVTVHKRAQQINTISIYSSVSRSNLQQGDEVTVTFYTYNLYGLASAEMEVEYDKSLLSLNSATLGSALNQSDSISSINTDTAGYIKISYADMNGVSGSAHPFLTLSFTAKDNVDARSPISLSLGGLNDADLNPITCNGATATLSFQKKPEEVVLPAIFASSVSDMGDTFVVNVVAEGETGLAAGDFVVSYDTSLIECTSAVGNENYLVVVASEIANGQVRFSFVAENGILEDTTLVSLTFAKRQETAFEATIAISGSNLVNSEVQPIEVSYQTGTIASLCHVLETTPAKAPTCTDKGWNEYVTCSKCGYTTYEEIAPLGPGHNIHYHNAQAPTCTEIGWEAYETCDRCDYSTYSELSALGHDIQHHSAQAPTCTEVGWNEYDSCSRGDYTTYVEIEALMHDIIRHDAKAPTCTEVGWNDYDTCSRCDLSTYEAEVIPALGHDVYQFEAQSPTCTEIGWNAYEKCVRCADYTTYTQLEPLGHAWSEWNTVKSATCTEKGSEQRACSRDATHKETREVSALGHNLQHHNAQAPTCTEIGWNEYDTCSKCDYTTYVEIEALMHDIIRHDAKAPTCTEVGWNDYDTCSRCDYSTYSELSALGHDIQRHNAQEPTCTEIGWNEYDTCSKCDYTTYVEIGALGHDIHEEVTQAPTCTEKGFAIQKCVRCLKSFGTVELDPLGHRAGSAVVENRVEPTCTTNGSYDEVVYCSVCSVELSRESKVVSSQHAWGEWNTLRAPTCTEKGSEQRVCNVDSTHKESRDIAPLGHDIQHHVAQAPTCTGKGWKEYNTCSRCEYTTYDEIAPLGHDMHHHDAQEPTCTDEGWSAYVSCGRCDYSTYTGIAALGHEIQHHLAQEPTCIEKGWDSYDTCDRCDYSTYSELPALGHNVGDWIVDEEPTDVSVGHKHKECTVCGEVLAQEDIDILPPKKDKSSLDWLLGIGIGVGCVLASALVVVIIRKKRKK